MIEIDLRKFYKIGVGCFSIITLMNLIGLVLRFNSLLWYDITSRIASTIFNFALIGLFFWLLRQLPPPVTDPATNDEILEMLK